MLRRAGFLPDEQEGFKSPPRDHLIDALSNLQMHADKANDLY